MLSKDDESPTDLIRARDVGGFDVWSLPSFDPHQPEPEPEPVEEEPPEMEEVPLEEVQPLTLEELESIRQEAYNEGFATGGRRECPSVYQSAGFRPGQSPARAS